MKDKICPLCSYGINTFPSQQLRFDLKAAADNLIQEAPSNRQTTKPNEIDTTTNISNVQLSHFFPACS